MQTKDSIEFDFFLTGNITSLRFFVMYMHLTVEKITKNTPYELRIYSETAKDVHGIRFNALSQVNEVVAPFTRKCIRPLNSFRILYMAVPYFIR